VKFVLLPARVRSGVQLKWPSLVIVASPGQFVGGLGGEKKTIESPMGKLTVSEDKIAKLTRMPAVAFVALPGMGLRLK
jgi:hypothetical protein